ncbi:hypothetical protein RRSWK_00952 [Rhodopirellula sp. SWK7]|nr:hypothetical protein RRSWK_00952 [Rhodopirellula sp. SWK7]
MNPPPDSGSQNTIFDNCSTSEVGRLNGGISDVADSFLASKTMNDGPVSWSPKNYLQFQLNHPLAFSGWSGSETNFLSPGYRYNVSIL